MGLVGRFDAFRGEIPTFGRIGLDLGMGAVAGIIPGIAAALIKRKMDNDSLQMRSPEEAVHMPLAKRAPPPEKKKRIPAFTSEEKEAFDVNVGHAVGTAAGIGGAYYVLNKLMSRKDQRHLDAALQSREDRLNQLLLHEQSLATGIPKAAMALVKRGEYQHRAVDALEKLAEKVYDMMEKTGVHFETPLKALLAKAQAQYAGDPAGTALAATLGLGGLALGFGATRASDPNTLKAKAIKDSLKERLTGKDQLVGPMPLRVESERLELQPLKPGASSFVDPTKGRDVLEGI
jgi:hypothetical protein